MTEAAQPAKLSNKDLAAEAERERSTTSKMSVKEKGEKVEGSATSRPSSPEPPVPLYEKDLVRTMAEVNFINGEVSFIVMSVCTLTLTFPGTVIGIVK